MRTTSIKSWNTEHAGNIFMTFCDNAGNHLQTGFVTYEGQAAAYGEDINASQLAFFELQKKIS